MQACAANGRNTEYLTTDVCMAACSANSDYWTMNQLPNDTTTFACRQAWADDAGTGISCANAGPLGGVTGGGGCVSTATTDPCTTFCQLEVPVCAQYVQYDAGVPDCISYCEGRGQSWYVLPDSGSDLVPHEMGDDTLNCRFYHLENAIKQGSGFGPHIHCKHTGPTGGGVCVSPQDAAATTSEDAGADGAATTSEDAGADGAATTSQDAGADE
jgi:hypothetical protein